MSRPHKRRAYFGSALRVGHGHRRHDLSAAPPGQRGANRQRDRGSQGRVPPRRWARTTWSCWPRPRPRARSTVDPDRRHRQGQGRKDVADELDKLGGTVDKQVRQRRLRARQGPDRQRPQGRQAARRRRDRPQRVHPAAEDPEPKATADGPGRPAGRRRPGREHPGRQPVHADQRDRRGRLQAGAPDVGRPRRDDRHHGLRCRPRQPGAADRPPPASARSSTGSPPPTRCEDATWRAMLTRSPARRSPRGGHLDRAGRHLPVQPVQRAITAGSEPGGDVNRDGDTTDTLRRPLRPGEPRHLGRHQPEPRLHRRRR